MADINEAVEISNNPEGSDEVQIEILEPKRPPNAQTRQRI